MAVLGPLEVGSGLLNFLTPNYAPVAGRAGPADWSYGGGGNYIRPWTSYSQRLVEATNSLGPFAMRLGGNITGRILISTQSESLGQLAYRDQPWFTVNDGATGYPSKAEWWNSTVKTVIQVRDMNSIGHPMIHVEVAIFDPTDPAQRYNPPAPWDHILGLGGLLFGSVPPVLGWVIGSLGPLPGEPGFGTGGGSGSGSNGGSPDPGGGTPLPGGGWPGDGGDPNPLDFLTRAATAMGNLLGGFANELATEYQTTIGEPLSSAGEFVNNVLMGIEAGELGVHNHVQHNIQAPVDGSFNHIPGETKSNPRDLTMRDGLQQAYAKNLGNGADLFQYNADGTSADNQKLHEALVNAGIEQAVINLGVGNNGAGTVAFYIHGRTTFNEGNFPGNANAAPNPNIDADGNLRVYDTYEFANSNLDGLGNWVRDNINADVGNEINAVFDTAPGGVYMYNMLNGAGSIREDNSGGTPGTSNISSLQNTYTAVVISPQNLQQSNPTLYNSLVTSGFYDHVDPSKLP